MFNYILNSVRSITIEIARLEDLSIQMQKTHDCPNHNFHIGITSSRLYFNIILLYQINFCQ